MFNEVALAAGQQITVQGLAQCATLQAGPGCRQKFGGQVGVAQQHAAVLVYQKRTHIKRFMGRQTCGTNGLKAADELCPHLRDLWQLEGLVHDGLQGAVAL